MATTVCRHTGLTSVAMSSQHSAANRRGIAFMTLSMASFIVNDTLVKHVGTSLPGPQLIFIRGLFASILMLAVAAATGGLRSADTAGGGLRLLLGRRVFWRSVLDATATMVYLTSLFHLPIGNATAINMATPLVISLMAAVVLRERISGARWLAIIVGFVGVLLVVQPAANAFNTWALLCLSGTLLGAARDLLTRAIHANVPSVLVTLSTAIATCLLAGGVALLLQEWAPVSLEQLVMLGIAGVFLSIAYYLLVVSLRAGEMSVISPFRYTALLFALLVGWAVWGDVPNLLAWIGIALLVGAGLYMLRLR